MYVARMGERRKYRYLVVGSALWKYTPRTGRWHAKNVTDAHAQPFVANDELLLFILTVFARCTSSSHANRKWLIFSVSVVAELSLPTSSNLPVSITVNSSHPHSQLLPHRARHFPAVRLISRSSIYTVCSPQVAGEFLGTRCKLMDVAWMW